MTDREFSQAELFDVFSNARRRQAVRYLKRQGGVCDLSPLVEQVAAWENEIGTDEVTRTQRRRVYISLYQTHLPMLEDHGIVDWDPDTHTIDLLPSSEVFEPYLDRQVGYQRPWHRIYAGVTALGVVTLALTWLSVGPVTATLAPAVAVALCLAVLSVSILHRVSRQPELPLLFGAAGR